MKAALLIVLSLSALAFAGPAFNKDNQIEADKVQQQQQQYMTHGDAGKQTQATETLKQWCFSSQMSQPELTSSFKKLVGIVKSQPEDQTTEQAVMNERICQGAQVQKQSNAATESYSQNGPDAQAHELIKDVYMDALIACESRECMKQLVKIINSNKVDTIRASYYMTRIAVTEKDAIKDESDIKQWAESLINGQQQQTSESVERQKLFAVTSLIGKSLKDKCDKQSELKQTAEQVAKTIVERYVKPVSQQEVQQYQQQQPQQQSSQVAKKIAKRNAALKALANIPGCVLNEIQSIEETLVRLAENKQEMSTVRQSAIECLEENDSVAQKLKQITFDQDEPIEVRVAAYRALMTTAYAGDMNKDEQTKQQQASQIVDQVVKHCEDQSNQQQDDQFVLYAISHLDNLRTSQQPEHQAIRQCITKNKQHYMQIQLLCKKFKQQLADVRKSSRNYKLEQEFNQLESGLIVEGDLIYESKNNGQQQQQDILPKLIRVNMSMPVMGETVNVVEITLRQNQMDEELFGALKMVQNTKFNSESMSKVVDSFKQSVQRSDNKRQQPQQQQQQESAEADLSIKVDGCTVVYLCLDDFKSSSSASHQRNTRSIYSPENIVDEIISHLKRKPVAFNRGFNLNVNERFAKMLDVEANLIAGLRFESRASGQSSKDFEIVAQIEPRFAFEAIVGPAKVSSKKLLQRVSTKTALGLRMRFKQDELVDVQVDLPMNTMELFTVETQMVEKTTTTTSGSNSNSYTYLPESIYGQEDIYSPEEEYVRYTDDSDDSDNEYTTVKGVRKMKRSIFEKKTTGVKSIAKFMQGKQQRTFAHSIETPEDVARATGLRGKLRVVASPKDMSFLVQAVCQKYEPRMQGYRVQVQKVVQRGNGEQKQYVLSVSTPGSRIERTMQVRIAKQSNQQRTVVKTDIKSPKMTATVQYELIHDGRQYAIKVDTQGQSTRGTQWRHMFESGVQRGSQQQSGRIATTYKPYLTIESSSLKRPVQMQGVVSYQQSPKSVISYELKSQTSGDFVQGKIILDERSSSSSSANYKRSSATMRRSMQSPLELVLQKDYTLTSELVGQVAEHAVKAHQMIDWDSAKLSLQADVSASHKNLRKPAQGESQVSGQVKLNKDEQMITVQRKCPQQERKEFRMTLVSDCRSPSGHQLTAELRYNAKRVSNLGSLIAYKHKVDYRELSPKKIELGYNVEFVATERQISEKLAGRTQIGLERNMKSVHTEMTTGRGKSAKLNVEYQSLEQHQIELVYQGQRTSQRTTVHADQRKFSVQSRTEKHGQMVAKVVLEILKQQGECQLIVEMPTKSTHVAADIKLAPGKLSSVAVQTPRFASKGEFSFEKLSRSFVGGKHSNGLLKQAFQSYLPISNLRIKTDLKDAMNQEAYWLDSSLNAFDSEKQSFVRFDSPIYRTDLEFDPREQQTKFGLFARNKRSTNQYNQLYSLEESLLGQALDNKLNLGNKLWMLRSIVTGPTKVDQLKQKARRALFEYADRRQAHKHSFDYNPTEERVNFNFERKPNTDYNGQQQQQQQSPMRFVGDLSTQLSFFGKQQQQQQRPSTISMESEWMDFDVNAKPFDGEESYAKVSALSRHRRSPFKKHESEIRYNKQHGYKAYMKHQDSADQRHQWQMEADQSPKKWAKMTYESDKHGKAEYEHQWRKHQQAKRSSGQQHDDKDINEEVYANKIAFQRQSPNNDWSHRSQLQWEEPIRMIAGRVRRSAAFDMEAQRRYNTIDYLKHVNARLNSQTSFGKNQAEQLYNVDFDYQPQQQAARLNVNLPNDMLHMSSIEFQPAERTYQLASKLYNSRTQEPSYKLLASTKPIVSGLATADQEPVFIDEQHPMLERPITGTLGSSLFKQPLKLDYSDKYGRIARIDYDHSPISADADYKPIYAGLRQKRAAVYYKDDSADFEHQSTYDFYPEAVLGFKQAKRVPGDISVKAQTKYGPVVVHADTTGDKQVELQLESPVVNAKLAVAESDKRTGAKLIKLTVDNKQQRVQLAKMVRKNPILKECELIEKLAQKLDSGRFEHQTELMVNVIDSILKIKSQTMHNQRPVMVIDGELNKQQEKAIIKIDGKRVDGQLVVDLATDSASLVLNVDDKRTVQHQTRLVRTSDKFFALDSMTSYKQKPLFKLSGKVSAMILEEPEHLFSRRRQASWNEEHVSTFEATLYEPKEMQIRGQFDCLKKEARVEFRDEEEKKVQETVVKFDDKTDTIYVSARLSSPRGQAYISRAKINVPGVVSPNECYKGQACQSEIVYSSAKSGNWAAKYQPGEYVSVSSPQGKQTLNLAY